MQTPLPGCTTPLQYAMLYRCLLSYRNKLQTTITELGGLPEELDDTPHMIALAGFQLGEIKELMFLVEKQTTAADLSILDHFAAYQKHHEKDRLTDTSTVY